jgi:hypothetical protein
VNPLATHKSNSVFLFAVVQNVLTASFVIALSLLLSGLSYAQSGPGTELQAVRAALVEKTDIRDELLDLAVEPVGSSKSLRNSELETDLVVPLNMRGSNGQITLGRGQEDKEGEYKPWRLHDVLQEAGVPDWLRVSGSIRLRYEGIDGQFRSASRLDDTDHVFVMRTLLQVQADFDPVLITLELMDSRQYGGDNGSAIGTSSVNAVELLQASATFRLGQLGGGKHQLRLGRQTFNLGSRRLVARNRFRNTINAFTGAHWEWKTKEFKLTSFYTLPVRRLPGDLNSLVDNELEFDEENFNTQFFGVHFEHDLFERHHFEAYFFGLLEDASGSRHRDIFTAGSRFLLPKMKGQFDYGIEGAYQFGESRLSGSGPDLDHSAWFVHAHIGYTFDAAWSPRVRVAFDYASGDDNPNDGDNNRFETLFGARRFEYGPTGIYGAVARFNLLSPELRLELKPQSNMSLMFAWRPVWVASDRDAWTAARVQDPTGSSGSFVGNQFETRWRWDIMPKSVRIEAGIAYLAHGEFQEDASGGQNTDTVYGYVQVAWTF